jgi:hypothetical protein
VAALASAEGAIAAIISVIAGEALTIPIAAMLCVIAGGVAVVAFLSGTPEPGVGENGGLRADSEDAPTREARVARERKAVLFGIAAALGFGISIYGTAKLGASMSPLAAVVPVRVIGFAAVFIPLLLSGRLRITRRAAPMVILIGTAEVLGIAAVAAIAAFLLFKERLSRYQRFGVVVIFVGVAFLTLARG